MEKIYTSPKFNLCLNDVFIILSDGVVHAGVGKTLPFGWTIDSIIQYFEAFYKPEFSAKIISTIISNACNELYLNKPDDDSTVGAIKIRERKVINLMIGPPA